MHRDDLSESEIHIAGRPVGPGRPCLIVGEVAQAHDGSLGAAHALVDAIADAGADAVKFQTHIAAAESTPAEPWRVKFSRQDESRYDYWRRMQFTEPQWRGLADHAAERGLVFLSSPFSDEAVALLGRIGMPAWKVASGEMNNPLLLESIAAAAAGGGESDSPAPVVLSSGMSRWAELDEAVALFRDRGVSLAVMQCTTAYPCPPERVGLEQLAALRERYGCPVGLSDHSGTIYAGLAAAALGADLIEVHMTLSRRAFGPDVPASVTDDELGRLVEGVRFTERALGSAVDKDAEAAGLDSLRQTFGKSLVAAADLPAGTVLERSHLAAKKPGQGIPAARYRELIGRRLVRGVAADAAFTENDVV